MDEQKDLAVNVVGWVSLIVNFGFLYLLGSISLAAKNHNLFVGLVSLISVAILVF